MLIRGGKVFIDGKFYLFDICVKNGLISEIGEKLAGNGEEINANGKLIFPGFIETHIHGGAGGYLENGEEQVRKIAADLPRYGVTSWTPTPTSGAEIEPCVRTIRGIRAAKGAEGADILGINLYTPYRNRSIPFYPIRIPPTKDHTTALMDGDLSDLKIILAAPEHPGGMDWIKWMTSLGVIVMIGYTEGTTDQMYEAADNGATLVDHFYNGLPIMNHHENGSTIGLLLEDRLYLQMICDLKFVTKPFVELAIRIKGAKRIIAVVDGSRFVGAPDGEYSHRGVPVIKKDGMVYHRDHGKMITGCSPYDENMRILYNNGFKLEDLGLMFSENAARMLRLTDRGKIENGRRADLVIMDEKLILEKTFILGKAVYSK
jgi:N-acetylglucosamine-6-phosphate deacetylase